MSIKKDETLCLRAGLLRDFFPNKKNLDPIGETYGDLTTESTNFFFVPILSRRGENHIKNVVFDKVIFDYELCVVNTTSVVRLYSGHLIAVCKHIINGTLPRQIFTFAATTIKHKNYRRGQFILVSHKYEPGN